MLYKETGDTKILDRKVLGKLFKFIKPYQGIFYLLIILTFATGVLAPSRPYMVQRTLDRYVAVGDYQGLASMTTWMLVLLVIQMMVQYYFTYLSDWLGQHVVRDLRIHLYAYTTQLRTSFYNKTPVGRLVTRNISDTEALSDVFSQGLAALLGDLLQLLAIAAFMVYIDWQLALLSLATLPLLFASTYLFKEKLKDAYKKVRDAVSKLNSFVQSRVTGMNIIHIFNREEQEFSNFSTLNETHRKAHNKSVLYYSCYFPSLEIMGAIGTSLLVWYGARGVVQGQVTLGKLTAFLMYLKMFFRPLYQLADRFNTLQMGIVSTDRIIKLLENNEQVENRGTYRPERLQGAVAFENICFAYEKGDYVLKDISFHIQAKQSLAIVGATGAGKSTIINLLERFYDAQQGVISIDGVSILDYDIQALRQNIGLVLQDVFLFSASIYDNITLGNKAIPQGRVIEAAQLVGIHDFIQQLPGGYAYNVRERGMTLSMGQRQLLAFVRVLVYNPCILILDEATASMDTETEALVQKATAQLLRDRTAILIAHRLATIQHADKILVLDNGKIKEEGTHERLLAQNGYYAELYNVQYQIA
ncbi:MAG: ABC transporter ATP-binding protein [Bacteroidota bacterium]